MFAFFSRILEMNRTEYGGGSDNDNIDTTIDYLFVSVQTNKTFVCRNINVFLFFQFTCQIIDSFLKCIT